MGLHFVLTLSQNEASSYLCMSVHKANMLVMFLLAPKRTGGKQMRSGKARALLSLPPAYCFPCRNATLIQCDKPLSLIRCLSAVWYWYSVLFKAVWCSINTVTFCLPNAKQNGTGRCTALFPTTVWSYKHLSMKWMRVTPGNIMTCNLSGLAMVEILNCIIPCFLSMLNVAVFICSCWPPINLQAGRKRFLLKVGKYDRRIQNPADASNPEDCQADIFWIDTKISACLNAWTFSKLFFFSKNPTTDYSKRKESETMLDWKII